MDATALKTLIDANKAFLTPAGSTDIEADTYVSTPHLFNLLTGSYTQIANPVTAPQIPKTIVVADLVAAAPATLGTISDTLIVDLGNLVRNQDRGGIQALADVLQSKGVMPSAEHAAVSALMAQTVSDPSWPSLVDAPSILQAAGYTPWPPDHDGLQLLINQALSRSVGA